jgi:hypothetical protein
MRHPVKYTCDRCGIIFEEGGVITNVEITFSGNGAMKDRVDGVDLCRSCYGKLVDAIREATSNCSGNRESKS